MEASEPRRRRPAIVAVDDEPAVLAAVARDLRRRFGEGYRIVRATSGDEALGALRELVARGEQVALLVADQRMPGLSGTEYLVEARKLVPDAKRVLLTAYADTEAAIQAINEVDLDYYLLKPWDPPEEQLYPVIEDLLTTWESDSALESGVRIIGHRFSRDSHDLRDFLARNRVPMRWFDVERDREAQQLLTVAGIDSERLPVALLEDGTMLERPTVLELAERLGVTAQPTAEHYDLAIVGGGPAGLAAAVYGASEGLRTVMVEREAPGGQAGMSSRIENYLGFPRGLSGSELTERATQQARRLGAELLSVQDAVALRVEGAGRIVELSGGGALSANCVLIASGVAYRTMTSPGFETLHRQGHLLRRGADRGAVVRRPARGRDRRRQLRRPGRHALLQVRRPRHDAGAGGLAGEVDVALPDRADRADREDRGAHGRGGDRGRGRRAPERAADPRWRRRARRGRSTPRSCSSARRRARTGSRAWSRATSAGSSSPAPTRRRPGWPLKRDPFLLETTVPGVFVAGDVRARSIKRVASAVGEGSMAVSLIHEYLRP